MSTDTDVVPASSEENTQDLFVPGNSNLEIDYTKSKLGFGED